VPIAFEVVPMRVRRARFSLVVWPVPMLTIAGCSWLFVEGPPPEGSSRTVACTSESLAPAADAVGATALGVIAVLAASGVGHCFMETGAERQEIPRAACVAIVGVPAVVYGTAAWWGFDTMDECREAKARASREPRAEAPAPPPRGRPQPVAQPPPAAADPADRAPAPAGTDLGGPPWQSVNACPEGEESSRAALARNPTDPAAHERLLGCVRAAGRFADLEQLARTALRDATPRLARAWLFLGEALRGQGRCAEALPVYRTWLAASPADAEGRNGVAACEESSTP
jgi:hypothetical protein